MTEPSPQRPVPGPPRSGPFPLQPAPAPDAEATQPEAAEREPFADLDSRPVAEHVGIFEAEHARLQDELSTIDQL